MSQKHGILLLSCVRHQGGYAPILAAHPAGEIVAVADDDDIPEWMHGVNQQFAETYDVPYVRNVSEALHRPDVTAVSICSEPTRHARLAVMAADSGKHVWLDKPLATTVADARDVVASVRRSGVVLTYVNRLYSPTIQQTRAAIDRGEVGLPYALDVSFISAGGLTSGAVEDFQLVVDRELSGGGELMNFLGYPVDTIRYLTGLEVTHVYTSSGAYFFDPHRSHGVEDFGVVMLTLERGVIASVTVGRSPTLHHPRGGDYTIRVHGSAGSTIADENRPLVRVYPAESRLGGYRPHSVNDVMITPLIAEFFACIEDGRQPIRTAEDGFAVMAAIDAAYRSAESGQPEPVEATRQLNHEDI